MYHAVALRFRCMSIGNQSRARAYGCVKRYSVSERDARAAKCTAQRYKQEAGLSVKTFEGPDKGKTLPTLEEAIAYEQQLTLTRGQSWPNLIK